MLPLDAWMSVVGGGVEVREVIAGDELRRHQFVAKTGIDVSLGLTLMSFCT